MPAPARILAVALPTLVVAGLAGVAIQRAACDESAGEPQRAENMISLEVKCERGEYIPGSDIKLDLRIINRGPEPVEIMHPQDPDNDQLHYFVVGPGSASAETSNLRTSMAAAGVTLAPEDRPAPAVIAPGAELATQVSLSAVARPRAVGEYRVHLRLAVADDAVESNECVFHMSAVQAIAIHVGLGVSATRGEGEGAFIEQGQLHTFEFRESSPEIAEADVSEIIHRAAVGNSKDTAIPSRNTPFFEELVRWVIWLDGSTLNGLTNLETEPATVALAADAAYLVKPPLKANGGPVEVLVLGRDQRALQMARFDRVKPPGREVQLAAGAFSWSAQLPAEAHAITAALAPAGGGSQRHLAFGTNTARGIEIFHTRYADGGLVGSPESLRVESRSPAPSPVGGREARAAAGQGLAILPFDLEAGEHARLLDGATPALHIDEKGDAWVSFLAIAGSRALWIEARFPSGDGAATAPRITELSPPNSGTMTAGAAIYVGDTSGAILRRDIVIELDDSRLARWDGDALVAIDSRGPVAKPMLLVPGDEVTYVVGVDEARGPYLEAP